MTETYLKPVWSRKDNRSDRFDFLLLQVRDRADTNESGEELFERVVLVLRP